MNRNKIIALSVGVFIILTGLVTFSLMNLKSTNEAPAREIKPQKEIPPTEAKNTTSTETEWTYIPPEKMLKPGEDMRSSSVKYTALPKDLFLEKFSWQKPEKVNGLGVVVEDYSPCGNDMGPGCLYFSEKDSHYYRIATFSYQQKNGEIIILSLSHAGVVGYNLAEYYFVNFNDSLTLLDKNSDILQDDDGLNKTKFLVDKNLVLPQNNNLTEELNIPGKQKLYLKGSENASLFLDERPNVGGIKREKIAYFDNKDIWNCGDFFVTFTNNIEGVQPVKYNIKLPTIFNLNNGQKEKVSDYDSLRSTGCGGRGGVNVLTEIDQNNLEKIGTADDGNVIFKYKNGDYTESYKNYTGYLEATGSSSSITYEKFVAENPFIIMKDGFGRYIGFEKSKFLVNLAECGKPVIYLYPKTETKINVQVKPNGGLTKVDPFYPADGWLVKAKPNGELTNLSDKQQYPYLFWEGNAYNMEVPSDGFVLKKENIKRDMTKLLTRLGLNEKETTDFLEFWQSKLEEKPYVFVTFVSQTNFDKVAPLNISPRPDKVIRVFMDYQPLDLPIAVRPLKIETPVRTGFTVVEWGGRLHQ